MDSCTDLTVSTTTVTAAFESPVNIIDIVKYLPIDNVVLGVKLVYAGGASVVVRGLGKLSKKVKEFYNQVTLTIKLNDSLFVSCKLFHNGTLHITGTRTMEEAQETCSLLVDRLRKLRGEKVVYLQTNRSGLLLTKDNVLLDTNGEFIGWERNGIVLNNDSVELAEERGFSVLVSKKWNKRRTPIQKTIYTLDGTVVGRRFLTFNSLHVSDTHKNFTVKFGYVYFGTTIVGSEVVELIPDFDKILDMWKRKNKYFVEKGAIIHRFDAGTADAGNFVVHMINVFFKLNVSLCRMKLHRFFLDNGFCSRYDQCSSPSVNLRFHYREGDTENVGKCNKSGFLLCKCKDISVSFFSSGKVNITGLAYKKQGEFIHSFLKQFLSVHLSEIQ